MPCITFDAHDICGFEELLPGLHRTFFTEEGGNPLIEHLLDDFLTDLSLRIDRLFIPDKHYLDLLFCPSLALIKRCPHSKRGPPGRTDGTAKEISPGDDFPFPHGFF